MIANPRTSQSWEKNSLLQVPAKSRLKNYSFRDFLEKHTTFPLLDSKQGHH
jgi:hypothetical protein